MAKIIKFPKAFKPQPAQTPVRAPKAGPARRSLARTLVDGTLTVLWSITVMMWPLLVWIFKIDLMFQLLRMAFLWYTPGVHAGWTFLLHMVGAACVLYFIFVFKPRGFD